jgi:hypothetical protein
MTSLPPLPSGSMILLFIVIMTLVYAYATVTGHYSERK